MATVRASKTTGRLYQGEQTVESSDPKAPEPQRGNDNESPVRTAYKAWTAAYRGFVPHGVRLPSPQRGTDEQFEDNPETFTEELASPDEPNIDIVEVTEYNQSYWNAVSLNVTTVPTLIAGIDPDRSLIRMLNQGPGMIYLGHNESVGLGGFPLPPMSATFYDLELHTNREIWAVQQAGQTGAAVINFIREYTKEIDK